MATDSKQFYTLDIEKASCIQSNLDSCSRTGSVLLVQREDSKLMHMTDLLSMQLYKWAWLSLLYILCGSYIGAICSFTCIST